MKIIVFSCFIVGLIGVGLICRTSLCLVSMHIKGCLCWTKKRWCNTYNCDWNVYLVWPKLNCHDNSVIFFSPVGGVGLVPKRGCLLSLAYYTFPRLMSVWRVTMEWYWQGKTEELREKPALMPLCPPQIPYGLTRVRTRVSVVRGRRLIAWVIVDGHTTCPHMYERYWWIIISFIHSQALIVQDEPLASLFGASWSHTYRHTVGLCVFICRRCP
jgi:hypothetical protein